MHTFNYFKYYISVATCLLLSLDSAEARRIRVPEDSETIQGAISDARNGDEVLVAPGTYVESIDFRGKAITVASFILLTEDRAYIDSTIIDANHEGPAVEFVQAEGRGSILRGFTIRNGAQSFGAGIDCQDTASPQLLDLHITENEAQSGGGGIYCTRNARPLIEGCLIDANIANGMGGGGIGIFTDAFPIIRNCVISGNVALNGTGGGGIWISAGGAEIYNTIIEGNAGYIGGGIYAELTDTLILRNTHIRSNRAGQILRDGGGLILRGRNNGDGRAFVLMDHVTITDNTADTYGALSLTNCIGSLSHLTISGNLTEQNLLGEANDCELTLKNSIIYGNDGPIVIRNDDEQFSVNYSDVEDADRGFIAEAGLEWLDDNIAEDPQFIDPVQSDFRLGDNSPCIDVGDPDYARDFDGTRTDMGAFPYLHTFAVISGVALDALTDEPLPNLVVTTDRGDRAIGDSLGTWNMTLYGNYDSLRVEFTLRAPSYVPQIIDTMIYHGEELSFENELLQAEFEPSLDTLSVEVDSAGSRRVPLTINNNREGVLTWSASGRSRGMSALPPLTMRDTLQISLITDDIRIEGAAFDGESYYLSGANDNDDNLIYVVSSEGVLLDSFNQVGSSRYGYKDIEWDGENLWAVGEDSVYCMTIEGEVLLSWPDDEQNSYIAYDRHEDIVWISSTTGGISGYDREGNPIGRDFDNRELRIYGLAFAYNDPDDAHLYILNRPITNNPTTQLTRMNTLTGDTAFVGLFPTDPTSSGYAALFIGNNFDRDCGSVIVTLLNRSENQGADRLDIFNLYPNDEWLSVDPPQGEVPPGGEVTVEIVLKTVADDTLWFFDTGIYEGELVFTHDGIDEELILPVTMTVVPFDKVTFDNPASPVEFGLTSVYPNPFNSTTRISFSVGARHAVPLHLAIYDLSGRMVADLSARIIPAQAGIHLEQKVIWDASSQPAGLYFVRLQAGGEIQTQKALLLK